LKILYELHRGSDIEKAIFTVLSKDMYELENAWHRHLKRKYTWLRYISDNIYWILFFIGAIVTVIGFLHLRRRMKTYPEDDEDMASGFD
jgi:hypothetical protein